MFFTIDPSNNLAIYDQIVRQIKFAIAGDVVRQGELVPSVRELARELAVNPNTVSRAYRELQTDHVLEPIRGTGLQVSDGARDRCRKARVSLIRDRIRLVLVEAKQSQLDPEQIRQITNDELDRLEKKRS